MGNRAHNAKRNISALLVSRIVTTLCPFIVRIIFIQKIGAEYLGLNSLFSSILQVLNITELGFSSAVVYSMYKPVAEGNTQLVSSLLCYFKKAYSIIGAVMLALGVAMIPFLKYLINGTVPADINLYVIYLLFLINTVVSYWLFSYKASLLNAYQRADVESNINTVVKIGVSILQILVLIITKDFYGYLICNIVATICTNFLINYSSNRLFPQIKARGKLSLEVKHDIRKRISGLMISKVCGVSRNALDSVFVSMYVGLTETAIYNNYFMVVNSVSLFMTSIYGGLLSVVGNSIATESVDKNYKDFQKMNFLYMWLSGWLTIFIAFLIQPFMELCFGRDMLFSTATTMIFSVYFYVLKIGDMLTLYVEGNGVWWEKKYVVIADGIVNMILNVVLGYYFGSSGIVAATVVSLILLNLGYGGYTNYRLLFKEYKFYQYLLQHLVYASVTAGVMVIVFIIVRQLHGLGIIILAERFIVCLVVPAIIYRVFFGGLSIYREATTWLLQILHLHNNKVLCKILL